MNSKLRIPLCWKEVAPGAKVPVEVDADAIAIVIDNLVRNAIDHSPVAGLVTIRVEPSARASERAPAPQLVVEDRGPGVPSELRARIFEPFARGGATDRAAGSGLGLGLAICKRIVDGHGGKIMVEDRDGGGTRFVVTLPPSETSNA